MSNEQPQPQRPPMREIEAGTGIWQRPVIDDEEDIDEPLAEDGWYHRADPAEDDDTDDYQEDDALVDVVAAPQVERPPEEPAPGGHPGGTARPAGGRAAEAPPDYAGQPGGALRSLGRVLPPPIGPDDVLGPDEDGVPERSADTMRIGIWGSPGSGKTTYLAAIQYDAVSRYGDEIGNWLIIPRNELSEQVLTDWTQLLVDQQQFPEATAVASATDLRWHFMGDLSGSKYARRRRFGRQQPLTSEFDLELIDVSGEAFGYRPALRHVPESLVRRTLAHLADSDGLIFLFDPIAERDTPNVTTYVQRVLNNMSRRLLDQGLMRDKYLPQHIAICVAKTDDVELVEQARRRGLVNTGPDGIDRVLNAQAEALFDAICDGNFWPDDDRNHGGAQLVRNQLRRYFHPARTRYYAISAIGHQNLAMREGKLKITGLIRPYNVLEPLVELHMQLRKQA